MSKPTDKPSQAAYGQLTAYLARMGSLLTYNGQTIFIESPESVGNTEVWGIQRRNGGTP